MLVLGVTIEVSGWGGIKTKLIGKFQENERLEVEKITYMSIEITQYYDRNSVKELIFEERAKIVKNKGGSALGEQRTAIVE